MEIVLLAEAELAAAAESYWQTFQAWRTGRFRQGHDDYFRAVAGWHRGRFPMSEATLVDRVEAGRAWLAKHDTDPPGRFYLWWQAKLRPGVPMPAQPPEVQEAYTEWVRAFEMWLRLYAQLEKENE